jgi:hypothetical protein
MEGLFLNDTIYHSLSVNAKFTGNLVQILVRVCEYEIKIRLKTYNIIKKTPERTTSGIIILGLIFLSKFEQNFD